MATHFEIVFSAIYFSGSMEPAFHRGDLLFLTNRVEDPIRVGEIVVFRIEGREIPIVHRVLKIHEKYECKPHSKLWFMMNLCFQICTCLITPENGLTCSEKASGIM